MTTAVKTAISHELFYESCAYWSWLVYQEVTVIGGVVWYPSRFSK